MKPLRRKQYHSCCDCNWKHSHCHWRNVISHRWGFVLELFSPCDWATTVCLSIFDQTQGVPTLPAQLAGVFPAICSTLRSWSRMTIHLLLFQEDPTWPPGGCSSLGATSSLTSWVMRTRAKEKEVDSFLPTCSWSEYFGVCSGRSSSWSMRGLLLRWTRWRTGTCSLLVSLESIYLGSSNSTQLSLRVAHSIDV